MRTAALLSIKPVYANQILTGTKTIELRKSSMGLSQGDVALVYSSAPEQRIAFWFRVKTIETLSVEEMWRRHRDRLSIEYGDYAAYFAGARMAVGLHVGEIHSLVPIPLQELEELIPGFVPPQGIISLQDEVGRYRDLLSRLSFPLPADLFLQQSFSFGFSTAPDRKQH